MTATRGPACLVASLPLLFAAGGCWKLHEVYLPDAGPPDAGPGPVDAPAVDARLPDGGPPDGGPICGTPLVEARAGLVCALTPSGTIPSDVATTIPIVVDICDCFPIVACEASVVGDEIRLETAYCPSPDPCFECWSISASCAVPPLAPGSYLVTINGERALELQAAPPIPVDPARPKCISAAPASEECSWPPTPIEEPATVCFPGLQDVGAQPMFRVSFACLDCAIGSGGCEVELERNTIHVRPLGRTCPVDECGPGCHAVDVECRPPALASGDYVVLLPGATEGPTLQVRDILPGTPSPEVCTTMP